MKQKLIAAVTIFIALWLGVITCMLYTNVQIEQMKNELSAKIDTIASDTDVRLGKMNIELNDIEAQMTTKDSKTEKAINQIRDEVRAIERQIDDVREEVESIEYATPQEPIEATPEEPTVSEAPGTLIASAVAFKTDNTYMEQLGDDVISYKPDPNPVPTGPHLTPESGTFTFEGHTETYYNLDMSVVVQVAQSKGIAGEYHVRSDGAKMIGDYIMVAADYSVHPYGSLVNTSLGMGIVVDTGGFIAWNPQGIDIAVAWP